MFGPCPFVSLEEIRRRSEGIQRAYRKEPRLSRALEISMPMKHHEISNAESLSLPIWALEDPYDPIDSFRLTDMYVYIYIYSIHAHLGFWSH